MSQSLGETATMRGRSKASTGGDAADVCSDSSSRSSSLSSSFSAFCDRLDEEKAEEKEQRNPSFLPCVLRIDGEASLKPRGGIVCCAAANGCVYIACLNGDLLRWKPAKAETALITFPVSQKSSSDRRDEIRRVFVDATGAHAIAATANRESFYIHSSSSKALLLPRLKEYVLESVVWRQPHHAQQLDAAENISAAKAQLFIGSGEGVLLECVIEGGRDRLVRPLLCFPSQVSLVDLQLLEIGSGPTRRELLLIATPRQLFLFSGLVSVAAALLSSNSAAAGATDPTAPGAAVLREEALVFEVPLRESVRTFPALQLVKQKENFPERGPASLLLFWATGAGLVRSRLREPPLPPSNSAGGRSFFVSQAPKVISYPFHTTLSGLSQSSNSSSSQKSSGSSTSQYRSQHCKNSGERSATGASSRRRGQISGGAVALALGTSASGGGAEGAARLQPDFSSGHSASGSATNTRGSSSNSSSYSNWNGSSTHMNDSSSSNCKSIRAVDLGGAGGLKTKSGEEGSSLLASRGLAEAPLSMVVTDLHVLLLYDARLVALSRISEQQVAVVPLPRVKYGTVRRLLLDGTSRIIWLFTDSFICQILIQNESASAWKLVLAQGDYSLALSLCMHLEEREWVIAKQTRWLLRQRRLEEAAAVLALSQYASVEAVALHFLQQQPLPNTQEEQQRALLRYLFLKFKQLRASNKSLYFPMLHANAQLPQQQQPGRPKTNSRRSSPSSKKQQVQFSTPTATTTTTTIGRAPAASSASTTSPQEVLLFLWCLELTLHQLALIDALLLTQLTTPFAAACSLAELGEDSLKQQRMQQRMQQQQQQLAEEQARGRQRRREMHQQLHELLIDFHQVDDMQGCIYSLLQQYGRDDELVFFAELCGDYQTVVFSLIIRGQYKFAIDQLSRMVDVSLRDKLLLRYAPLLFRYEPQAFAAALQVHAFHSLSAAQLLPALLHCREPQPPRQKNDSESKNSSSSSTSSHSASSLVVAQFPFDAGQLLAAGAVGGSSRRVEAESTFAEIIAAAPGESAAQASAPFLSKQGGPVTPPFSSDPPRPSKETTEETNSAVGSGGGSGSGSGGGGGVVVGSGGGSGGSGGGGVGVGSGGGSGGGDGKGGGAPAAAAGVWRSAAVDVLTHFARLSSLEASRKKAAALYSVSESAASVAASAVADAAAALKKGREVALWGKATEAALEDPFSTSLVSGEGSAAAAAAIHSCRWLGACGLWTALTIFLAEAGASGEQLLLRLLASHRGSRGRDLPFDAHFSLRFCLEVKRPAAAVVLYGVLGLHTEAVRKALSINDMLLAQHAASAPSSSEQKRLLWMLLAQHAALHEDVPALISLVKQSGNLLKLQDVLPFVADSTAIDALKSEICEALDGYERKIAARREEMQAQQQIMRSLKQELQAVNQRCVEIPLTQTCDICCESVFTERFYAFACGHCFHSSCTEKLKIPAVNAGSLAEFERRAVSLEKALEEGAAAEEVDRLENLVDDMLADECLICGSLMISSITMPFIDPIEDAEEIRSWQILEVDNSTDNTHMSKVRENSNTSAAPHSPSLSPSRAANTPP